MSVSARIRDACFLPEGPTVCLSMSEVLPTSDNRKKGQHLRALNSACSAFTKSWYVLLTPDKSKVHIVESSHYSRGGALSSGHPPLYMAIHVHKHTSLSSRCRPAEAQKSSSSLNPAPAGSAEKRKRIELGRSGASVEGPEYIPSLPWDTPVPLLPCDGCAPMAPGMLAGAAAGALDQPSRLRCAE